MQVLADTFRVMGNGQRNGTTAVEWPTLALLALCSSVWLGGVWLIGSHEAWWGLPLLAFPVALHSSLQHEIIHGHPTRWTGLNTLLVAPAVGLFLPFLRFRELHVRHHSACDLGDPEGDPESPYLSPGQWQKLGRVRRLIWQMNATLTGRLVLGPVLSIGTLIAADLRRLRQGESRIAWHWLLHIPALLPVVVWLAWCGVPLWAYALLAAWPGMSILMLRTFAEHRWYPDVAGRSVTVDRGGVFALLFLNNHLHAAHHYDPARAWYRLPDLSRTLEADGRIAGERFGSYGEIARRWAFRVREPIVCPREANAK